jgi:ASC-1-like (ASCH) protein
MGLGFILCGEAYEQYKGGETEMLLRRPISAGQRQHDPDDLISVTEVHDDSEWKDVRNLLLDNLRAQVEGAGQQWLESLRHGSDQRSGPIHAEHRQAWVYGARDRAGRYRAAAIVTSKKGGSLKVMPIAAADPAGFRALILDLPALLTGKGRKAYIHHTPSSSEVSVLQESSWRFEAQLPGAYHEDVVTQQWGCRLSKDAPNLRIKDRYFRMIMSGEKTLEIRVAYDHIKAIEPGSLIRLTSDSSRHTFCSVADVRRYPSLEAMVRQENVEKALPGVGAGQVLDQLRKIYPPEKERLGIIVLELSQHAA